MRRSVRSHLFPLFTAPRVSGHSNQPMLASDRAESETTYKVMKIEGLLSGCLFLEAAGVPPTKTDEVWIVSEPDGGAWWMALLFRCWRTTGSTGTASLVIQCS